MPDSTLPSVQSPGESPRSAPPKRRRWLLWGCGGFLAFALLVIATVAITVWWIQRPIKPVVLSAEEQKVVNTKLEKMRSAPAATSDSKSALVQSTNASSSSAPGHGYQPGGKELRLTERELNGLLNQNTDLGRSVRLELDTDAINAYVAVPVPKDFPVGGGRTFRARGRFRLSLSKDQAPVALLEDVTVLGLSLPKAWLGGLKGRNLLADAMDERNGSAVWKGIKSLRIEPGVVVLEVND